MAINALTGNDGSCTIPAGAADSGALGQITKWNATISVDEHDTTVFDAGVADHEEALGGMYDLKGSCEGFISATAVPTGGAIKTADTTGTSGFVVVSNTGNSYTFTGIVPSLKIDVPKNGFCRFTCNFESSGAVVEA